MSLFDSVILVRIQQLFVVSLCAFAALPCMRALAQPTDPAVIMAPPFVQGPVPAAQQAAIVQHIEEALSQRGWNVVRLDEAKALSVPHPGPCSANACALEYATAASADAAIQLSLFQNTTLTFSVALVQPPNDAFVHDGALSNPVEVPAAFDAAVDALIAQRSRGPGPWLVVRGAPINAVVKIDGEVLGAIPLRARVPSGEHVLIVSAEGYRDFNTTIRMPGGAGTLKEMSVQLDPSDQANLHHPEVRPLVRRGLTATGSLAAAAGVGLLLMGALSDDCFDHDRGRCVEREPQRQSRALLLGGASAVLGGVALIVAPWALTMHRRHIDVATTLTPTSLTISGDF